MGMLPETYSGSGPFAEIAEFMNRIHRIFNNVRVFGNGRADVTPEHFWLYLAGASGAFSGTAFYNGTATTGLASDSGKPYVRYKMGSAWSQQTGPMPSPWPSDEFWYEKAYTYGHIVLVR